MLALLSADWMDSRTAALSVALKVESLAELSVAELEAVMVSQLVERWASHSAGTAAALLAALMGLWTAVD